MNDFDDAKVFTGEELLNAPIQQMTPAPMVTAMDIEENRAIAEVKASMAIAQQFPRNERMAEIRIVRACNNKDLAEKAEYAYPRGGKLVSGPAIPLIRTIAREWGNLSYGIRELYRSEGHSVMEAYCWDMERNNRASRVFVQPHRRAVRGIDVTLETDRDVYEQVFSQGARRERAAIEEIVPDHIIALARRTCQSTLANTDQPVDEQVAAMVEAFNEIGVTAEQIANYLRIDLNETTEDNLNDMRRIYRSISDGICKVSDFFKSSMPKTAQVIITEPQQQTVEETQKTYANQGGGLSKEDADKVREHWDHVLEGATKQESAAPITKEQKEKINQLCDQKNVNRRTTISKFAEHGNVTQLYNSEADQIIEHLEAMPDKDVVIERASHAELTALGMLLGKDADLDALAKAKFDKPFVELLHEDADQWLDEETAAPFIDESQTMSEESVFDNKFWPPFFLERCGEIHTDGIERMKKIAKNSGVPIRNTFSRFVKEVYKDWDRFVQMVRRNVT